MQMLLTYYLLFLTFHVGEKAQDNRLPPSLILFM